MIRNLLLFTTALALTGCNLKDAPKEGEKGAGTEKEEADAPIGKFADTKLADFEARAKKANWKVHQSAAEDEEGFTSIHMELEDPSHYAYITVIDVAGAAKKPATAGKMGDNTAIAIELEDGDEG